MPDLLEAYRRAYRIRRVEEEISHRYHPDPADRSVSPMRTPVHLSVGQETISVGVAMAIEDLGLERHVWINHRGHAPYLAFGGDLQRMLDELHGKATGCSGGRAGSMHLHDEAAGVMGGSPIVGSAVSLATGSAWAAKIEGSERLTVVFCGDAVPETGQFWESLNFALLHRLKLLYVIEDNRIATATPKEIRNADLLRRMDGAFLSLSWCFDDGFEEVCGVTRRSVEDHEPPWLVRVSTRRCCAHVGPEIDWTMLEQRDPVGILRESLLETPTRRMQVENIEQAVDREVRDVFERAGIAPWPEVIAR